jgi:pimeloyl-ACP methyl ester carboxylesterase
MRTTTMTTSTRTLALLVTMTQAPTADAQTPPGSFAEVNGVRLYYEVHGSGRGTPLVMLHGGVAASEVFGANVAALAQGRRVVLVHLQGHGYTRDIERPWRYEAMADDVAALVRHLGLGRVDVLGLSTGGGVAIQTAIRHAAVVRRLVVVAQPMRRGGWYPEVLAEIESLDERASAMAEQMKRSPLSKRYPHVDWARTFRKTAEMHRPEYDWSAAVSALRMPVMLVFADADAVYPEHVVEFWKAVGGGARDAGQDGSRRPVARLAIIPGATHYDIASDTRVATLVAPFLDAAESRR